MTDAKIKRLERRVKLLELALNWYADPRNYHDDDWGVLAVITPPDYGHPGRLARLALANETRRLKAEIKAHPTEEVEPT